MVEVSLVDVCGGVGFDVGWGESNPVGHSTCTCGGRRGEVKKHWKLESACGNVNWSYRPVAYTLFEDPLAGITP